MRIVNSRNIRTLLTNSLGSGSFKQALKDTTKSVVKNSVSLASNQAINKVSNRLSDEFNDTVSSILNTPVSLVKEAAQSNSVHETSGSFNYNPNNGRNYNYNLASEYMDQYHDYMKAKRYINTNQSNLAYHMFQKEKNRTNPSLRFK